MRPLLVLRPEPGATATIDRARALGLTAIAAPLFTVRPLAWTAPDPASHDALMLTSANAVRHGGADISRYRHLPLFVVGEATAAAARAGGFKPTVVGKGDAADLLETMAQYGVRRALHLCGREHRAVDRPGLGVVRLPVYAAEAVDRLPEQAVTALEGGAVVLLHSPRAARRFAELLEAADIVRGAVRIAAISQSAVEAAGTGWAATAVAKTPDDPALLAAAFALCD